jgi:hypothetical protein
VSIVSVHRVFRLRSQIVYERTLDTKAVSAIENAEAEYIQWMLQVPTIFTKGVAPTLARELSNLPYYRSLEDLIAIIESYPASFTRSATQELGILISINGAFKTRPSDRKWFYKDCYIVTHRGRKKWLQDKLPRRETNPKQTYLEAQKSLQSPSSSSISVPALWL